MTQTTYIMVNDGAFYTNFGKIFCFFIFTFTFFIHLSKIYLADFLKIFQLYNFLENFFTTRHASFKSSSFSLYLANHEYNRKFPIIFIERLDAGIFQATFSFLSVRFFISDELRNKRHEAISVNNCLIF